MSKVNIGVAMIGIVFIVVAGLIGFVQVPKEELYWQKINEYNWKIAIRTIMTYPYLHIALVFAIAGGFLELFALILRWATLKKCQLIGNLSRIYHKELKDLDIYTEKEKIEQELKQINPSIKTLRNLIGKRNIKTQ